jgi:hypothetical protein
MRPTQHPSNNWVLPGTPAGWDREHAPIRALPITRAKLQSGLDAVVTFWQPSPDELKRLAAGQKVALWVMGSVMPPVQIEVHE